MYHALLTNRYLTSRVIPFIAVAAVALCVALVIVVVSVMTGFLNMVKNSGKTLMGDVVISYPIVGIPHYDRLLARLRETEGVTAASPVVESLGLLKMPYPDGPHKDIQIVQFWGIEPESFAATTGYADTLYWRPLSKEQERTVGEDDPRRMLTDRILDAGRTLRDQVDGKPGIVLGMHVSIGNERMADGTYRPLGGGMWWMPRWEVMLTTLPIDGSGGASEPESYIFPIVNEFVSGVYMIDNKRTMIPLEIAQRLLHFDAKAIVSETEFNEFGEPLRLEGADPARVSMILVRGDGRITPDALRARVIETYEAFAQEARADASIVVLPPRFRDPGPLTIKTWLQQQADFIGPVEKEREMMRTLFSLVYLVCAGLVLAIFWAIVYEKTRDIGILRSVGASRIGISWIFLRYGLVVGVLGAIAGFGLASWVVHNINHIHHALSHPPPGLAYTVLALAAVAIIITIIKGFSHNLLPVVLGGLVSLALLAIGGVTYALYRIGGVLIWDPRVYYFTQIPNEVDFNSAIITIIGAVVFSLIGAFLPAARAADTDPVRALRYD